ncbi:unnamed protein product [Prunus armeniaca]|uniref:Uncharacterized protein n=1 Tax=Prunus armeniaca TaxID=36596 RepID=A0A6J5WGK2_PRUAR|nr:unnamed protein product [Prunus armeniaca]
MFIEYGQNSVAYKFLVVKSDHNVIEGVFPMKVTVKPVPHSISESESNDNLEVELRRSKRARKETNQMDSTPS